MTTEPPKTESVIRSELPQHVAIIMDGNGRWAERRGKNRIMGHKAGVEAVRETVKLAQRYGVKVLTLYAFSSENWRRPATEVSLLMDLFLTVLSREVKRLDRNNVKLQIIGDTSRFSDKLQQKIAAAEQLTANNDGLVLNVAANYGGRWDVANAARQLAVKVQAGELQPEEIDEDLLHPYTAMADLPAPDLLIRTGGDYRISNFLLWQLAYAEFYFTETLWPDFDDGVFKEALASFVSRERRFGCTGEQARSQLELQKQNN